MQLVPELAMTLAAVVDEGSMDAAARRLHITPSAVSQRIRALEEQAGRVLLVRSRPARPTSAAHPILRYARQLALLHNDALAELGEGRTATLPIAVNADSLATWFLPALARAGARHEVVFDLHRDDQDFTATLLEAGTVTAAVTSRAEPVAGCRVTALGVLRYEAMAAPAVVDRWFPDGPTPAALAAAPVVDFDARDDLQSQWLAQQDADLAAPPRHRVPASHDFVTAVRLGLGWAMLPRLQAQPALDAGELVLLGGAPVDVPLHWQQWNLRSPLLDDVAAEIVAEARRALIPPAP
ncbi:LysR family transcriptional regulator ArgP [Microbacterium sp. No. 7]|uniref:LysR family transcriptional regulator ArgP n=1 Tax=Microbacterium sp. No. 7 TaxID=1714373 RepID=UPI0006D00C3E|nr:LysR family transcriptional regulator ArgP [Microbacterium sp. No. 7]ALJ21302.1 chromosome replication initiation inhibitor protein [Microbacterium sp. No. 7]